jgi:hypothetical protein
MEGDSEVAKTVFVDFDSNSGIKSMEAEENQVSKLNDKGNSIQFTPPATEPIFKNFPQTTLETSTTCIMF